MKILYGVQGTGNGHVTRARHMAESFGNQSDIEVDYLFSGRSAHAFFDMENFGHYQTKRGLTFFTDNGQIRYRKTILKNNLVTFLNEVSGIRIKDYDLVINDFEPVSAWAAKKAGIPSLSISHQAAFLHHIPKKDQNIMDKLLTQYFAPTRYALGTHWYHFGHSIIPPVVASDLIQSASNMVVDPTQNTTVLVYLPFESLIKIKSQLQVLSEWQFVCYHPHVSVATRDKNIVFEPLSTKQFKQDLIKCSGVISNSGFELSTECLSIGKPLLVKPLKKQYEQISNAYTLQKLGLCEVINDINPEDIDEWLQSKKSVKIDFPTNCNDLVEWIKQGDWQSSEKICQSLWQQVHYPSQVKDKLDNLACAHQ